MIFGRNAIGRLAFGRERNPEVYSARLVFAETESFVAAGRLDASVPMEFAEVESFEAAGRLDAAVPMTFAEIESFEVGTEVVIDKFLRLINAATARRVYLAEMHLQQFR